MATAATSVVSLEAEVRKLALAIPVRVKEDDHEEEMRRRRRCLAEGFRAFLGSRYWYAKESRKVLSQPCVLYHMKVSIKRARISWSHRSSRRFFPERRGATFPILLCRALDHDDDDQVEQLVHRSSGPGEPDRPGVLSGIHASDYYFLEESRERAMIQRGSSPPLTEVAVIRGMPGGRGISVTSHVHRLVVRLNDLLFRLSVPDATVDIRFSEQWFCLPTGWTEERLFAEDDIRFVDIATPIENLVRKLYEMRQQEDQEMERRRSETKEERERRLEQEEAVRRQEEEERRKIRQRKREERKRRAEAAAAKPRVYPAEWNGVLGKVNEEPPVLYSKFSLSMNSKQVLCKCIEQEDLKHMLQRVDKGEFVLPISKTAPMLASSVPPEILGFVEGYSMGGTCSFGPKCLTTHCMDTSGRTMSSVLMASRSAEKVFKIVFIVDKLNVLLDDGLVMSGRLGTSVDIHCDDISCSEFLTTDWGHHILCKNIDGEGIISFSTLLVHLKKKLQLQLTEDELGVYFLSALDEEEEIDEVPYQHEPNFLQRNPTKPKHESPEVELCDYSMLFPSECDV